jgi:hypothetical protein
MSRAFSTFRDGEADDVIVHSMRRDLDRLIEQLRSAKLYT